MTPPVSGTWAADAARLPTTVRRRLAGQAVGADLGGVPVADETPQGQVGRLHVPSPSGDCEPRPGVRDRHRSPRGEGVDRGVHGVATLDDGAGASERDTELHRPLGHELAHRSVVGQIVDRPRAGPVGDRRSLEQPDPALVDPLEPALVIMDSPDEDYRDLGADWFARRTNPDAHRDRLVCKLNQLGYDVELAPAA